MSSFTPGPWYPGHFGSEGTCQCKSVVSESYAGGICTVQVDNGLRIGEGGNDAPPRDEAIANMHLIAAAPELLQLVAQYRDDLRRPPSPDSVERRLKAIDAVIAKAEGRS